jgi:hypothetical protein
MMVEIELMREGRRRQACWRQPLLWWWQAVLRIMKEQETVR